MEEEQQKVITSHKNRIKIIYKNFEYDTDYYFNFNIFHCNDNLCISKVKTKSKSIKCLEHSMLLFIKINYVLVTQMNNKLSLLF